MTTPPRGVPDPSRPRAREQDEPVRGPAAYAAELLGTFTLVFFVVLVVAVSGGLGVTDFAVIGLVHLFLLMLIFHSLGGTSGAHVNPAVTAALALQRKIAPVDAAVYVVVQLLGAVLAALLVKALLDDEGALVDYGATQVAEGRFLDGKALAGLVVEGVGTFFLMWAVMAMAVDPRGNRNWAGFVIGGTLGLLVMAMAPLTGAAFNPARSFGPALVSGEWPDFWIYVVGPLLGAILAALAYQAMVLAPQRRGPGDRPVDHLD